MERNQKVATKCVHVNSPEWAEAVKDGTAEYIGRENPRKRFKRSKWANPYKIAGPGDYARDWAIIQYIVYLIHHPELLAEVDELADKTLGCFCKPLACHGETLASLTLIHPTGRVAFLETVLKRQYRVTVRLTKDISEAEYQRWSEG